MNHLEDSSVLGQSLSPEMAWDRDDSSLQAWRNVCQTKEARVILQGMLYPTFGPATSRLARVFSSRFTFAVSQARREMKDREGQGRTSGFISRGGAGGTAINTTAMGMNVVSPSISVRDANGFGRNVGTVSRLPKEETAFGKFWNRLTNGK